MMTASERIGLIVDVVRVEMVHDFIDVALQITAPVDGIKLLIPIEEMQKDRPDEEWQAFAIWLKG